jgi:Fanconi anemia group J protein
VDVLGRMTKEYKIGGITVEFPYKAYGPQLAYMSKVVHTLERSRLRPEGKCNVLLESPTGSGKSLALLYATLAWQQHYKGILNSAPEAGKTPAISDPLVAGGGFIVEDTPEGKMQVCSQNLNFLEFTNSHTYIQLCSQG